MFNAWIEPGQETSESWPERALLAKILTNFLSARIMPKFGNEEGVDLSS